MPDGRTADAVYIILNGSFRDLLNHVEVRPLDYDYLLELAPGPQRLYELLSFPMFGALANDRPRARLVYSQYCLYAPQMRYFDFNQVKKQMYKVHLPHRESEYIVKVEYQETSDREGRPDWEMFYTPGPKALREHDEFTSRNSGHKISPPQSSVLPAFRPEQQTLPLTDSSDTDPTLLAAFIHRGIAEKTAKELVAKAKPGQQLLDQLEWMDTVIAKAPKGKIHNPPGLYISTIRDNVSPPDGFFGSRKRQQWEAARQAKAVESARKAALEMAYDIYQNEILDTYVANLPVQEYRTLLAEARSLSRRTYRSMTAAQIDDLAAGIVRRDLKERNCMPKQSFAQFCQSEGLKSRLEALSQSAPSERKGEPQQLNGSLEAATNKPSK